MPAKYLSTIKTEEGSEVESIQLSASFKNPSDPAIAIRFKGIDLVYYFSTNIAQLVRDVVGGLSFEEFSVEDDRVKLVISLVDRGVSPQTDVLELLFVQDSDNIKCLIRRHPLQRALRNVCEHILAEKVRDAIFEQTENRYTSAKRSLA